jgi:hypothetical protein
MSLSLGRRQPGEPGEAAEGHGAAGKVHHSFTHTPKKMGKK